MEKLLVHASEPIPNHMLFLERTRSTSPRLMDMANTCRPAAIPSDAEDDRALAAMLGMATLTGLGFWTALIYAAF
jgi:hypothetical protein